MRVVGITGADDGRGTTSGGLTGRFTAAEEEQFRELSQDPDVYGRIAKSIAPSIFGFEVSLTTNEVLTLCCMIYFFVVF